MKRLKTLENLLFLMSLFGIIPIILAAFDTPVDWGYWLHYFKKVQNEKD